MGVRLDHASLLPAVRLAGAGVVAMVVGALLWTFDDEEPMVDFGPDDEAVA